MNRYLELLQRYPKENSETAVIYSYEDIKTGRCYNVLFYCAECGGQSNGGGGTMELSYKYKEKDGEEYYHYDILVKLPAGRCRAIDASMLEDWEYDVIYGSKEWQSGEFRNIDKQDQKTRTKEDFEL